MTDRDYMENMLLLEKGACDLLMHGAIESSSTDVHQTFATSLGAALRRQEQIYGKMQQKGWYPTKPAQEQDVQTAKQKYQQMRASL